MEFVHAARVPKVELSMVHADVDIPKVAGDNIKIGQLAAMHLLERGYHHFAWAPFHQTMADQERRRGFKETVAATALSFHDLPPLLRGERGDSPETVETVVEDWPARRKELLQAIMSMPRPLAIFAYNDCTAADIVDVCTTGGVLIPEEIAVMGVDDDPYICHCAHVSLSSVIHDMEGMAYAAAELLDRLMDGEPVPEHVIRIPPRGIVTRASTDMWAVEDLTVAQALRFIFENYHRQICVPDIASHAGTSRRPLEIAFRKHLNQSIHDILIRCRMDKVKELLQSTKKPIKTISRETGFTRPNHLFRCFKQRVGMSPTAYRRKCAN